MCLAAGLAGPLIGAALSGVGSLISMNQQQKDAQARAAARNQELLKNLKKQEGFANEARGLFDTRREALNPEVQAKKLDEAQTSRADEFIGQFAKPSTEGIALSGNAPKIVQSEFAKRFQGALDKNKRNAQNLGRLGGFGQVLFDNSLDNVGLERGIGTINNFSQSENALLPHLQGFAEVEAAKPPSGVGSLLTGLGSAFGSASGSFF